MKAWQPVPTLNSTIIIFSSLTLIFLIFGIVLIATTANVVDIRVRYDTKCGSPVLPNSNVAYIPDTCNVSVTIDQDISGPIFVYYELENFYQNHRRYVKSRDVNQLKGTDVSSSDASNCEPIITYADLRKYRYVPSTFPDTDVANPCGLVAASVFNDTYTLYNQPLASFSGANQISISGDNIAWPSDRNNRYSKSSTSQQWLDVLDERFMVWMRTAALPRFRKLWGRIDSGISKGSYTLQITNQYPVDSFDGKKYFTLSTTNAFGGRNSFLGISYLVMGILSLIVLVIFLYKKFFGQKKKVEKQE